MSLKLPARNETYKVVLRIDSAIGCPPEDYDRYLDTLDESILQLKEDPTRLVMRKVLPYRLATAVQDYQVEMKKGEMNVRMSFMSEEVRCALVGIENPPHLPESERIEFKSHSDGGASEDLMSSLAATGLIADLYKTRQNVAGNKNQEVLKKS